MTFIDTNYYFKNSAKYGVRYNIIKHLQGFDIYIFDLNGGSNGFEHRYLISEISRTIATHQPPFVLISTASSFSNP